MRISDWSSDVCSSDLWSKAEAEKVVEASALDWVMVRPPAIYGPGDMEMRDLFRLARWGIALLPPPGKLSVIEVSDLARLLLALVDGRSNRRSAEQKSELQYIMRISYAVFRLKKKNKNEQPVTK